MVDISKLRKDYKSKPLNISDIKTDPFDQFSLWLQEAHDLELPEPHAMVLATADSNGRPSSRTVLLRGLDRGRLTFFTNYGSRKAVELEANPRASSTFLWMPMIRQVTVEGRVEKLSHEATEAYWLTRPRGSQLSAWTSRQGEVVPSREALESRYEELTKRFADHEVPCPDHWGGYALIPERIEFWQGRENRLHDRFSYRLDGEGWTVERLSP